MTKTDFNQLYNNFTNIAMEARISFRIKKLLFELPSSEDGFNKLITTIQETNITKAQALNDIEDFFLTMKYCYSGYEYFSRRIDFDTLKRNIIDLLEKSSNAYISSIALGEMIFNQLSGHLNDGHFSIIGFGNFLTSWRAYVTQIVVEKDGGKYRVIKGSRKLPIGTVIEHSDLAGKLLPTLIIGNHYDCFLIGIYSQKVINEINVGDVVLRTHMIGADKYVKENSGYLQKYEEHRDYNVFFSKSYQIDYNPEAILDEYYQFGKKCRNKKITIFDVAGNQGGNSRFPQSFIKGLNEYAYWQSGCAVLVNPVFNPQSKGKSYQIESTPQEYDNNKGQYKGTLYVIMNKGTTSSGEAAVSYAKSCPNSIFLGSATGGIGTFGDVKHYRLRNSKLLFQFGHKIFYMPNYEEGKGFIPNYWLDSKNPWLYLKRYLKHSKN